MRRRVVGRCRFVVIMVVGFTSHMLVASRTVLELCLQLRRGDSGRMVEDELAAELRRPD